MDGFPVSIVLAPLVGLAFAGTLVATVGLITDEQIGFDLFFREGRRSWRALPLLVLVGPLLLLRSLGPREGEGAVPPRFAVAGYAIVLGWSIASGHVLMRLISWASTAFALVI